MREYVLQLLNNFNTEGTFLDECPYGSGHINDTRLVTFKTDEGEKKYILQKINKNVFKEPDKLMENYVAVTEFLKQDIVARGGDPMRETLNVIKTKDGENFLCDEKGEYWRLLVFVADSASFDRVETPEQFYSSAVAFGNFQYMLRKFPAETLHETIPNFHNTPDRYRLFLEAVENDLAGRRESVEKEIEFVKERCEFANALENAHKEGRLPLRVTHNDTKFNNILFDKDTGAALCIIDLDTIMPGYSVTDFGDAIRSGATTAAEDETDLSLIKFNISLYDTYVKGFIEGAHGGLTEGEIELLPTGAMMMTFECGMRFLTDYLNGDTYFKTHREGQNLDRARNQFKLLTEMEERADEMMAIVKKYS